MMFTKRSVVSMLLLQIFTCGIYSIFWTLSAQDEFQLNYKREALPSGVMVLLLSIVTCGIYQLFWMYKTAQVVNDLSEEVGLGNPRDELLLFIIGFITAGIVFKMLIQDRMNKIVDATY